MINAVCPSPSSNSIAPKEKKSEFQTKKKMKKLSRYSISGQWTAKHNLCSI
jgi:hypothetical protein